MFQMRGDPGWDRTVREGRVVVPINVPTQGTCEYVTLCDADGNTADIVLSGEGLNFFLH